MKTSLDFPSAEKAVRLHGHQGHEVDIHPNTSTVLIAKIYRITHFLIIRDRSYGSGGLNWVIKPIASYQRQ